jgi:hypothetical protein
LICLGCVRRGGAGREPSGNKSALIELLGYRLVLLDRSTLS